MPTKKPTRRRGAARHMSEAVRQRVCQALVSDQDEANPKFLFQQTAAPLLLAIAGRLIDPLELARRELTNRGLDQNGEWVGFQRAARCHGVQ